MIQTFEEAVNAFRIYRPNAFERCTAAALVIAGERGEVTADDIRQRVNIEGDRRILGAVLAHLVRAKLLVRGEYTSTTTKGSHGRPIMVFKAPAE
jgi:hypothetical protein